MDVESSSAAVGLVICLFLLAFSSAADAAMSGITRHRLNLLQQEDAPRASLLHHLLEDPSHFKAAILLLNTSVTITAAALTIFLTRTLTLVWQVGALALLLVLILIFSESLPKAIALRNPQGTARFLARPMVGLTLLLRPLINATDIVTRPIIWLFGGKPAPVTPLVTEEEIRLLVNVGEEEGLIEADERDMIEGVISFGDTLVREVMIPRVDIVALESSAPLDEAINTIVRHGHSRIPVFEETIDQIVGILYAKDILAASHAGQREASITALLRKPHFVPELMKVDALLRDLKARKVHMAIVVDEYGGTAGLVTIEDLLEEIVGEIQDEYDVEEPAVQFVDKGELVADARVLLDDLNDLTGLRLESEESDRLGGLVYEQLGRVPEVGDKVYLPGEITITVVSVEGLAPRRLRVTYPHEAGGPDEVGAENKEAVSGN